MDPRPSLALAAAALLCAAAAPNPPQDLHGTYRLQGRASVDAQPFPAQESEVRADAVLAPGARAGEVRIRLAGEGFSCELTATMDASGALAFAQGQRCTADLRSDETEGRVEGRLSSGSGRLRDDVLDLQLAFALSGAVRLRSGGALDSIGQVLSLPGSGGDPVPVRGEARGRAQGRRDRSRAAD